MGLLILIVLLVLLLGALPTWPYSKNWGFHPSLAAAVLIIVVLALILSGHVILVH